MSRDMFLRVMRMEEKVKTLEERVLELEGHAPECAVFNIPPLPKEACDCKANRKRRRANA